jgi:peptide chain release factor 2
VKDPHIMEAERINALSALLADLTIREAELRRYL